MFITNSILLFAVAYSQTFMVSGMKCWSGTTCTGPTTPAFSGSWDQFNLSPSNRTVSPVTVLSYAQTPTPWSSEIVTLEGNGSQLIFDFEKLVGGIVTVTYSATDEALLGLAFSEAKNWTGEWSDSSNGSFNPDGAIFANITATNEAKYVMPIDKLRGGFRYLTMFQESKSSVSIRILDVTVDISFQPDWPNLRAYKGYFSCSDDLLTKIWYSGAYTLQTNAIPPSTGRAFPILGSGWSNKDDLSLGVPGSTVYVDGAKRDRTVWSGDLVIAVPSILVSTGDWDGVKTTLEILYAGQKNNGELPFAGPNINIYRSDTYHMATLIATFDYFLWTGDNSWLRSIYPNKFKSAMQFITSKIDKSGLLFVTGTEDWGRISQGGHNTEANVMLYKVLVGSSRIAQWMSDTAQASIWFEIAVTLKASINNSNFDDKIGAYKNTDLDSSFYPQDGNSLALVYNLPTREDSSRISDALTRNWISIGSLAPELPNNLVGFGQSFEIKGHFVAHKAQRALELIRRAWGWYLNNPFGTASTCIEGYRADGSFGYRAETGYANDYSYTSHSHGWSTGPTDALTSFIVGLTINEPGGLKWTIAPQFADLTHAEAGFSTPLGKFRSKWSLVENGFILSWQVPSQTQGIVVIPPIANGIPNIELDGKTLDANSIRLDIDSDEIILPGAAGNHTLRVTY